MKWSLHGVVGHEHDEEVESKHTAAREGYHWDPFSMIPKESVSTQRAVGTPFNEHGWLAHAGNNRPTLHIVMVNGTLLLRSILCSSALGVLLATSRALQCQTMVGIDGMVS